MSVLREGDAGRRSRYARSRRAKGPGRAAPARESDAALWHIGRLVAATKTTQQASRVIQLRGLASPRSWISSGARWS